MKLIVLTGNLTGYELLEIYLKTCKFFDRVRKISKDPDRGIDTGKLPQLLV
jgi:hypothetical protein